MTTVRPATPDDVPAMESIRVAALRACATEAYDQRHLSHLLSDGDESNGMGAILDLPFRTIVAERSGDVVGFGTVHVQDGQVHAVYVHPEVMERGVGRAILARLERDAREAGVDELTVLSTLNAVGFYEACGYDHVGRESMGPDEIPVVRLRKD